MNMSERSEYIFKRLGIKKEKQIPFLFFLGIIALVFIGAKVFDFNLNGVALVFFLIVFSILCLIAWFMAGVAVFRSVAVASVVVSVIIFLAQSYCELPLSSHTADDALKGLFGFGLLYAGFLFIKSLHKELTGGLKTFEKIYAGKKPWILVVLFAAFIGLFVWQLYQVITPIIYNLCIY